MNGALRGGPAIFVLCGLLLAACNSSNPVEPPPVSGPAPATGSFNVVVSTAAAQVAVGATDPVAVTVSATGSDGRPAADGTQVVIDTDLGTLSSGASAPASLLTLQLAAGRADVEFLPGDKLGKATVLAQVGTAIGSAEIAIVEQVPESFFVSAVEPNVGVPDGGDSVTIVGDGFVAPLLVSFATAQATVVTVASPQEIVVTTPPTVAPVPAGTTLLVDVSVTKDLSAPEPKRATLAGAFTYAYQALPTVFLTGLDPASGPAAGGTSVTLAGGGFLNPLRVDFGTAIATVLSVGDSRIVVVAPPSPLPVGVGGSLAVDVTLHNALDVGTQAPVTLPAAFTYLGDAPPPGSTVTVTSAHPTEGSYLGGTQVVVNGSGFVEPVAVDLGGVRQREEHLFDAGSVQFATAGVAVTACPPGGRLPQQGVTVTNLGTGAEGSLATFVFDYLVPLPRLSLVSPSSGSQAGGDLLQIAGNGFEDPVRVVFTVGGQTFVGSGASVGANGVQVLSPTVPDVVMLQVGCTVGDPPDQQQGSQYVPTLGDVEVINLVSGCADTLPNTFSFLPTNQACRTF
jgi:IPT/TIG domain